MKLMTDRCCAANDSMFFLPSRSVSPNAYGAPFVENKMRASANVIHPRSSGGNADKERASVASVVPSSFMASRGGTASAPNSFPIRLFIAILEVSRGLHQLLERFGIDLLREFEQMGIIYDLEGARVVDDTGHEMLVPGHPVYGLS